jgi:integrase/recombinase XerD
MDYTEYLVGLGLSGKSVRLYVSHVVRADAWIRRHTHTSLDWAGPREIAAYSQTLPDSHSTRGQVVAAFRHYWDYIERSNTPHRALRVPPAPEMVCRAITETQARDLAKTAMGWWPQGTVVLAGLYLALRRFEIAKMEWGRFDDDLEWYRVTGKYDKTNTLPVHPLLVSELEGRRNGKWLFPGRYRGRHIAYATVGTWVTQVGTAAGIPSLEPHELRHTALATANDRTGNLRSVQTFARHSKVSTTSGYTRTTSRRLREVSDSLDYL